ncbi:MAG: hypothetical protein CVT98_07045 [Bacteroidetes bacterium HGW-Bacteroidetes-15]|nr:MAG: hypothetical protein CVT98_07045 [Bacteroidetes bacterium HGW-Bacteroidetes-15]
MLHKLQLFFLLVIFHCLGFTQNSAVDSLENILQNINSDDTVKVNLLNELANEYYRTDINKTLSYAIEADSLSSKLNYSKGKAESLRVIGRYFWRMSEYNQALKYFEESLQIFINIDDKEGLANCYNNIGSTYWRWGDYPKTLEFFQKSLELREELGDKEGMAASYNNLGIIYRTQGDFFNALDYYHKSVALKEEINDKPGISDSYNNIAIIYSSQGDNNKALEYHNKSLAIREELGALRGMSVNYNNISIIYVNLGDYQKALEYVKKSIEIREKLGDRAGLASAFNNIAEVYMKLDDQSKALEYYKKSIEISVSIGLKTIEIYGYIGLAETYLALNNKQEAYDYSQKAYTLAQSVSDITLLQLAAKVLSSSSASLGKFKTAYEYFGIYKSLSDSIQNEENTRKIVGLEYEYKYKKEKEIARIEQEKLDAIHQSELMREKSIRNSLAIGIAMVLIMFATLLYNYIQKRKINHLLSVQKNEIESKNTELTQLNEEIQSQNDHLEQANHEITAQKEQIEESHYQITESLTYAKFIQNAVLPKSNSLSSAFSEHFILFLPCNIVSGDFYFIKQVNQSIIIAAADCTGHGVPGALMSMLGITLLNEILRDAKMASSAEVLTELRHQVKQSLHQSGEKGEQRDGMDIAFCSINQETLQMSFAGAYNPCWIFRSDESNQNKKQLFILEADKTPVGVSEIERPFTEQIFQLQKGDSFYIFTDGYHSQFGGEKKEKYQLKRLKALLTKIQNEDMITQKKILDQEFNSWKGQNVQVDDILIIGVKI